MDEPSSAKALVSKRAWERRRSRGDYFRHSDAAALDLAHNSQQAFIASVRRRGPFAHFQSAKMTVVIVQAAELQPQVANRAPQFNNLCTVALLDAGAIQAGIHVAKDSQAAAAPLLYLFFVFGQNGDAYLRELLGDFADPPRIRAHGGVGEGHGCHAPAARRALCASGL